MRQVRLDELTYLLFSGIGSWSDRMRKTVASGKWQGFDASTLEGAAKEIIAKLYKCDFHRPGTAEPITADELVLELQEAIRTLPKDRREAFGAREHRARDWARYHAAHLMADRLGDFTILRDTPEPPFFRFANFEGGTGPVAESDDEHERRVYGFGGNAKRRPGTRAQPASVGSD